MTHTVLISEIENWLLDEALGDPDITALFAALCKRLNAIGLPAERAAVTWPTLHPLFRAEHLLWTEEDGAVLFQAEHANADNPSWVNSPFNHVLIHDLYQLRRRLDGPQAIVDFPVLEELAEKGFTDYLLTASSFSIAEFQQFVSGRTGVMASWATTREGGFTDDDLTALIHVQKFFAVACRQVIQKRVMANVANTYLGPTAGWRVLSGAIRRSDGEKIRAVIWYSDLRGSTRMSERMDAEDYLKVLNTYFECTAGPVIAHGGEILNFIGDAVLAIFPIESEIGLRDAVRRATAAVDEALHLRTERCKECAAAAEPPEFGVALSVGEVMFGNIGVPQRLAFSAIGRNVNAVSRIDQATKLLGEPVLATRDIADVDPDSWIPVGAQQLNDLENPVPLFARKGASGGVRDAERDEDTIITLSAARSSA